MERKESGIFGIFSSGFTIFFSIQIGMKMGEKVTLKRKLQIYPSTIM